MFRVRLRRVEKAAICTPIMVFGPKRTSARAISHSDMSYSICLTARILWSTKISPPKMGDTEHRGQDQEAYGEKRRDAVEFVRKAFASLWPVHLFSFNQLLIQLRNAFVGDLDLMLVLAVIGERTRPESWQPEPTNYLQLTRRKGDEHLQVAINIQSVAEYSGIARETVRRKVRVLQEKGWVERDEEGRLTISSSAAADLEQSTLHSIRNLAAISSAIQAINRGASVR